MPPPSPSLLELVYNHIALPPKLPGKRDTDVASVEKQLVNRLIKAADILGSTLEGEYGETWKYVRKSLEMCRELNSGGVLEKARLLEAFKSIQSCDDKSLILHVAEQNAAIIVRFNGE